MRNTRLENFNVHVIGEGDRTVVLAHGFGSDQTAWRYIVEAVKPSFRLVLFDHMGCGHSKSQFYSPQQYASLEAYRDDVISVLETLGLQDTIFVGHSFSAMVALLTAATRPKLIKQMVLIGASPRYLNDDGYVGGFEQTDLNAVYTAMADDYLSWTSGFGPMVIAQPEKPELGKEFSRTLSAMRPDIAQSAARVLFEVDCRPLLPTIRQPVLILQTRHDVFVPMETALFLADHLPTSELVVLDTQGHLPHLSAPNQVLEAMNPFISRAVS